MILMTYSIISKQNFPVASDSEICWRLAIVLFIKIFSKLFKGNTIAINCFIDNQSKKSMTLKASLKQIVIFHAEGKHRKSETKLVRSIGNTINATEKQSQVIGLLVPVTAPIVHNCCPIIDMKYLVVITLDIPGSFDLHCELPVILTNGMPSLDIH